MRHVTALFVLSCAIVSASAHAQDKGPPPGFDQKKAFEQMQQQMLMQFDANRDGKLSDQEKMAAQEAMRRQGVNMGIPPEGFPGAEQFAKQFDRDGDGKLNQQEAMMAQQAFQRMRNNNGGMRGALPNGGGGGGSGAMPQQPIVPPVGEGKPAKVTPLIKRFDKDGDGKLNADEKAAAQAEFKKDKSKEKEAKPKEKEAKKDK
jgi:hypothetical protein